MRLLFKCLAASLAIILALLGTIAAFFSIVFWEPDAVKPGSTAYLIAIPSAAKSFPLWQPCSPAKYSYRFQDGLSPETYWIDYQTKLSRPAFEQTVKEYLVAHGCQPPSQPAAPATTAGTDPLFACKEGTLKIRVTAEPSKLRQGGCLPVTILFREFL